MAYSQGALVDLLDRVLDRGVVINADIIISLAGVPLIGIQLRAALAGMETMTRYGLLKEWDQTFRATELPGRRDLHPLALAQVPVDTAFQMSRHEGKEWQGR